MPAAPQHVQQKVPVDVAEVEFDVSGGRDVSLVVDNPAGNTFTVFVYMFTDKEESDAGVTAVKHTLEAGITDLFYNKSFTGPVARIVVGVTVNAGADPTVTVRTSKKSVA